MTKGRCTARSEIRERVQEWAPGWPIPRRSLAYGTVSIEFLR